MKSKFTFLVAIWIIVTISTFSTAWAQNEAELTLGWSRDFGYSSGGGDIQGVFSLTARGPENIVSVQFFIDDKLLGVATEAPFKLQFTTDNHPLGMHTIFAIATLSDGRELRSRDYQRNFVSADQGMAAAFKIIVPILGLVLGIVIVMYLVPLIMNKGKRPYLAPGTPRKYGFMGGAICPRCGRPFAIHFLSFNISFTGRLDYCPHCGKWSFVRRVSLDELRRAEQAELEDATAGSPISGMTEEEKLRKDLDDSRYQNY